MSKPFPAKFRKKPVVIEAMHYARPSDAGDIARWVNRGGGKAVPDVLGPNDTRVYIHTLEGDMTASVGDWVIRGVKGEFYPCRGDIFTATYDPEGTPE